MNRMQGFSQTNHEATKNPWFVALLGLVAVFLIVNIIFIVVAINTNPGLVTDDYYKKGQDYEKNVATRLNARNKLNWQTKFDIPEKIYTNTPDIYRFSAVDSRGVSIMDADVTFTLYRPSDSKADFIQPVTQIAPGLYQSKIRFPLPGIWDLTINVINHKDVYHDTHRITVLAP